MAISKGNNNQENILLGVSVDVGEAEKAIQELEKSLDNLQDAKINANGDELIDINNEIKETEKLINNLNQKVVDVKTDDSNIDKLNTEIESVNDSIDKANQEVITPKTNNKDIKGTILSIEELEQALEQVTQAQRATKDKTQLAQLSAEARALKASITEAEDGFKDTNQTIGILEDQLYALAGAGKANSEEFNNILLEVAQLKKNVLETDMAVDALSTDKFGKFIGMAESMTTSFQGVTGALQLMGVEAGTSEAMMQKLMALQSIAQGLQGVNEMRKRWSGLVTQFKQGKVVKDSIEGIAGATKDATDSTKGLATGMDGVTKATKTATLTSRIFSGVLKGLGIGLITSAIAYLIANFDSLKDAVLKFIPGLKVVGDLFTKVGQAITDFVGITSDATRALDKLDKSTKARNEGIERQIELLEAEGGKEKEVAQLRQKIYEGDMKLLNEKAKVNKKLTKEEQEQQIENFQKMNVLRLQERKRVADEAKENADKAKEEAEKKAEEYKQKLDQLKGYIKEAEKVTYASNHNARQVELKNINDKYKDQIEAGKKLGQDISKLEEAQKIERNITIKKYDDQYFAYIKSNQSQFIDAFSKEYLETANSITELKKTVTEEQKADLDEKLRNQLVYLSKIQQLALSTREAENDLANASIGNEIDSEDKTKVQRKKLENQLKVQREYDEIIYQNTIDAVKYQNEELERIYLEAQERMRILKEDPETNASSISILQNELNAQLSAIDENNRQIEDATRNHNRKILKDDKALSDAKKKLDKADKEAKLENMETVGNALGALSQLAGENTVAGKSLAIATATMDTYVGANKVLAQGGLFGIISASAVIATGLLNVKKILDVNVEGATDTSGTSTPSYSAPVVNTTQLRSQESGVADLNDSVKETTDTIENKSIKAYIVNSDLKNQEQKDKFYNRVSSY